MLPELILLCVVLFNTGIRPVPVEADEAFSENNAEKPPVSVQCQGLLRHGIVAIGGETTGTTISFHRITWELQLADDDDREFAALHHKKPVLVTGALRKVVSTESMTRWIIDVKKISASDSRDSQAEVLCERPCQPPAMFQIYRSAPMTRPGVWILLKIAKLSPPLNCT
jgi:hypothetical protein